MSWFYRCVQNAYFGRLVYSISNHRYFKYPEDFPGYIPPKKYEYTGDIITLEWDEDDAENPQNWPKFMKAVVIGQITVFSFLVYLGGPIYAPAMPRIMEEFNVSYAVAALSLSFYILGYGIGQMFCSPLSEHPSVGRTPVYFVLDIVAVIIQIPTALCDNITALIVLRFLSGLFISPAFSVGGASCADIISPSKLHIVLYVLAFAAFCGPSTGPIIAEALLLKSWRNIFWLLFAVLGFFTILMFFTSPETNQQALLLWKAQRLRRVTGNPEILTKQEQESVKITASLSEVLLRAFEIIIKEPIALLINLYTGLVYGCLYLWFEAFPIAFEYLGFSEMAMSAAYNVINVGTVFGALLYIALVHTDRERKRKNNKEASPDIFLVVSFIGLSFAMVSFFWFGWTVNPKIHWIVPIIGAGFFGVAGIVTIQANLNYLGMCFPNYIASVFGGNGFFRAVVGGSFPIYGKALFNNLAVKNFPVAWGCSVIGFISLFMLAIPLFLLKFGKALRNRSKFSR